MKRGSSGINALIGIDKPKGMSSHDVVNRVRRILGEKRVGHAGTLDPLATGVLVVGIGQATRLMNLLTNEDKSYEATICFGIQTSTDDAEGEVVNTCNVPSELMEEDFARAELAKWLGKYEQVPPQFSAISVDGKRAYKSAREGEEVELAARSVEIFSAELLAIDAQINSWNIALRVSKGFYVRSFARDLGTSLNNAAHTAELRRVSSGDIQISNCITLETLEALTDAGHVGLERSYLNPLTALGLPVKLLVEAELEDLKAGRTIPARDLTDTLQENDSIACVHHDRLYGVWQRRGVNLVCSTNFVDGIEGAKLGE